MPSSADRSPFRAWCRTASSRRRLSDWAVESCSSSRSRDPAAGGQRTRMRFSPRYLTSANCRPGAMRQLGGKGAARPSEEERRARRPGTPFRGSQRAIWGVPGPRHMNCGKGISPPSGRDEPLGYPQWAFIVPDSDIREVPVAAALMEGAAANTERGLVQVYALTLSCGGNPI
jgi:hypothetical protein